MHTLQIQVGSPSLTRNIVFMVACFIFHFVFNGSCKYVIFVNKTVIKQFSTDLSVVAVVLRKNSVMPPEKKANNAFNKK